ncbi:MAG: thiamine biosynthesis protein ThiS [Daejeonella sp.]|nr:thiamine biosynthesis protein ThiS [Daejeonella sp.]
MEIIIDKQVQYVQDNCSVQQLIESLFALPPKGLAIAINECVVPKSEWGTCILQSNDKLLLIKATQGG